MSLITKAIKNIASTNMDPGDFLDGVSILEYDDPVTGQRVTSETCKNIATAYRCINVLSDDVAKLPLQTFMSREPGKIERVKPSSLLENISWLLELSPNRWMTPLVFKKTVIQWLLTDGAAYIWNPPWMVGRRNELFILPSCYTKPVFVDGNIWYKVEFPGTAPKYYPDAEVLTLLINSLDGITGRSVICYARETIGRQLANYSTQNKIARKGLNPSAVMQLADTVNDEARKKIRDVYEKAINESAIAVIDQKVAQFTPIRLSAVDSQFLESIKDSDVQIANYFGVPLYKLNQGKQSYQSNEQQNLDYLNTTLDPYLVQWEQAATLKWLTDDEQNYKYFKFNRDALLRTDAKSRAETLKNRIQSGQLTPNEARDIEDRSSYPGGDGFYQPSNIALVAEDGSLKTGGK